MKDRLSNSQQVFSSTNRAVYCSQHTGTKTEESHYKQGKQSGFPFSSALRVIKNPQIY